MNHSPKTRPAKSILVIRKRHALYGRQMVVISSKELKRELMSGSTINDIADTFNTTVSTIRSKTRRYFGTTPTLFRLNMVRELGHLEGSLNRITNSLGKATATRKF